MAGHDYPFFGLGILKPLALFGVVCAAVLHWPSGREQTSAEIEDPITKALVLMDDSCKASLRPFATENSIEWVGGGADAYCFCVSAEAVLSFEGKSDEDVLEAIELLVANQELRDGYVRLEYFRDACAFRDETRQ